MIFSTPFLLRFSGMPAALVFIAFRGTRQDDDKYYHGNAPEKAQRCE